MLRPVTQIVGRLSVRARIVALALIPVAGFLANGIAYMAGEAEADRTVASVRDAARLADASQDFKGALSAMRIHARDFGSQPRRDLIATFEQAHSRAVQGLDDLEQAMPPSERQDLIPLRTSLSEVAANFADLALNQERLGFSETVGARRRMSDTAGAIERIIHEDLSWMREADSHRLLLSLLTLRRYESEFRLSGTHLLQTAFFEEHASFNKMLDGVIGAAILKEQLAVQVKDYADAFAAWIASVGRVGPLIVLIDRDTQAMMPVADRIIATARNRAVAASAELTASQSRTQQVIAGVGFAAILIGLAFSWLIGRSITLPLRELADAMKRLADGDTAVRIPATRARDEIGEMARTVLVFRDTMIERERLSMAQSEAGRASERRSDAIARTIAAFRQSVEQALGKVRGAAGKLEDASSKLTGAADAVSAEATTAETRVGIASENVSVAAGSVEELAASIGEIARQAAHSTEVAGRAVSEARRTAATMIELDNAAQHIGEVVGLIQAIAGQTSLLALNATIEAARAGEAGRGFAVVASEVKSLAGQTARATGEISAQVGAIQSAAADAARAIEQVNAIIAEMSSLAATVAGTVEEQNAAVAAIADGVNRASTEARDGASAMSRVAGTSADARATSGDVRALADSLAGEAEALEAEVRRFLADVQAA